MGKSKLAIIVAIVLLVVGLIVGGLGLIRNQPEDQRELVVPDLSAEAKMGEVAFANYCVECHGKNAAGSDKGPPLVHQIYRPSHHSDFSFVRAMTVGVPQHHWLLEACLHNRRWGNKKYIKSLFTYGSFRRLMESTSEF
jgi:hypothetical protein